ncbi:MAG TPA: L,D-transpeptidase family protein, partial [Chitinophagaceae bacterium]
KYSVYLHDTNQRYLFSREKRALSHGCVRVQDWKDLAYYLLYNDSTSVTATPVDSLEQWLAVKEKHVIPLRKRVPLFIRYFTCEVKEDKIIYHEDIYEEDKRLIDQYFTTK